MNQNTNMHVCVCACVYIHTHIYIYTYIYLCFYVFFGDGITIDSEWPLPKSRNRTYHGWSLWQSRGRSSWKQPQEHLDLPALGMSLTNCNFNFDTGHRTPRSLVLSDVFEDSPMPDSTFINGTATSFHTRLCHRAHGALHPQEKTNPKPITPPPCKQRCGGGSTVKTMEFVAWHLPPARHQITHSNPWQ